MKCSYCDFEYKDKSEYGVHLNATHTKCFYCRTVFFKTEFGDGFAVCLSCRIQDDPSEWDLQEWVDDMVTEAISLSKN